ncbi:N-6 DNA methylase [Streptomyces sp. NPDC004126]|uniref:N-6 DNA methylase n=1 Tax=Streptomyces sp. NPDC004126 TaxID=3390695 RepID=UPI003D02A59A
MENWLTEHDKVADRVPAHDRIWPYIEALGDRDRMGAVIAEIGRRLPGGRESIGTPGRSLEEAERALVDRVLAEQPAGSAGVLLRGLLDRWLGAHVRQIATTPAPLAELLADLVTAARKNVPVRHLDDPACGTGGLLAVAAARLAGPAGQAVSGTELDPTLAELASVRLMLEPAVRRVDVTVGDTLRGASAESARPDAVVCVPPANERDWGRDELLNDPRWTFGIPPRTEPELAWVQHIVSSLAEDGVAVVVLPPAVAARRAGRRIRAALVREGCLRAVVALPVGAAPPRAVGLHVWVLVRPRREAPASEGGTERRVALIDAADCRGPAADGVPTVDWEAVRERAVAGIAGLDRPEVAAVPVVELLGGETDLTPARRVAERGPVVTELPEHWNRFDRAVADLLEHASQLRGRRPRPGPVPTSLTVAELEELGHVRLAAGAPVPVESLRKGVPPAGAIAVIPSAHAGRTGEGWWMFRDEVADGATSGGPLTVTVPGDVVVGTAFSECEAWVENGTVVLGSQLHRLRTDPDHLDPWFLAAALRGRANGRRAAGHASLSSRVDVRRLRVMRLPVEEQRAYGALYRRTSAFEAAVAEAAREGMTLSAVLGELLAGGQVEVGHRTGPQP